ncbi:MAG: NAD-dependent malic enzyme [Rhodothermales bacterium]|nr:NAD-dependent malic enzyme [Rhodothermales bacterium]
MESATFSGASNSFTLRLALSNRPGTLARVTQVIGEVGANIGAIDIVRVEQDTLTRDITVYAARNDMSEQIVQRLDAMEGVRVVHFSDRTFLLHLHGKIEVRSKMQIRTRDELSMAYTPGVARVCRAIAEDPRRVFGLTIKGTTVAVVTDGTAVLGLGDIGPEAALPVMEGKAQLFKEFGDVNAFPICLATKDVDAIVETVKRLAPGFGGINLEDIAAPRCFEIERRLKEELDIPVFHDDQHGTAVVTTAALINALKVVGKAPRDLKVVMMGVGAAGTAVTRMLMDLGVENIIGFDRKGALHTGRDDLNDEKRRYAEATNPDGVRGTLKEVMQGADVFIGLSVPGVIDEEDLRHMAEAPIVFAMANPDPEIAPERAWPYVAVMATGRSDYPNQINNVLCFPGIFKGALDCRARDINEPMKMAAARAIAGTIDERSLAPGYIIPSVFDQRVAPAVAEAVHAAAVESGVARKTN